MKWMYGVIAAMTLTTGAADAATDTSLIPRSALFGNPVRTQARLSPDGKYISFLAPADGFGIRPMIPQFNKLRDH